MTLNLRVYAYSLSLAVFASGCAPHADNKHEGHPMPTVRVQAHPAEAQDVASTLPLTGELISEKRTQLSANATGQVIATLVERGQAVAAQDVLVRLDVRGAQHTMAEAQANVANLNAQRSVADKDCQRTEALHAKGAISQQEYDRGMAQCKEVIAQSDAAQARLRSAQKTITDGAVRAPFAGVITERRVSVGDYVQPSSEVATLLQPDPLRLRLTVPEANLFLVKIGTQVIFTVPAVPDRNFNGCVRYVSGEVRPSSRDVVVEAVVENKDRLLMPGMFATVSLQSGTRKLPVVPAKALLDLAGHPVLQVVRNGRIEQHAVRIAATLGDQLAIESGIAAGDLVVDVADASIVDGSIVN